MFMVRMLLLVALTGSLPAAKQFETVSSECDVIELNTVYSDEGKAVFSQVIFWDWYAFDSAYHVRAYVCNASRGRWEIDPARKTCTYEDYRWRFVAQGQSYKRTHTQYDPEVQDRESFPVHLRRGIGSWETKPRGPAESFYLRPNTYGNSDW